MQNHVYFEVIENFSSQQMFDLVNDLDAYPKFIPNCIAAGAIKKTDNVVTAFMTIEKLGFHKKLITNNTLIEPKAIKIEIVDGPFKHFIGLWRFEELAQSKCKVSFELDFEFQNQLFNLSFSPLFKEIMQNMVHAFTNRAKFVYSN